jgi:hypothetical protein
MGITGTIKYRGLSAQRLIETFEQTGMEVMGMAKVDAQRMLKSVVGTQYASLAELRKMGHPYAREALGIRAQLKLRAAMSRKQQMGIHASTGRGGMPMPPGYINRQSGKFASSFVWEDPRIRGNQVLVEIQSSEQNLEQILINGTPTMVERPFKTLFMSMIRDRLMNRMRNEYRKAIRVRLVLSR